MERGACETAGVAGTASAAGALGLVLFLALTARAADFGGAAAFSEAFPETVSGTSPGTFNEAGVPGGAFSADHRSPTRVPAGVGLVAGTGGVDADDYLLLDLAPGAATLVFEFRAPEGIGYSYSAGGVVLFDTQAFAHEWAGTQAPEPVRLDHRRRRQSMAIALPDSFGGRLFLALNWTHGEGIAYRLSVPANLPVLTAVEAGPRG